MGLEVRKNPDDDTGYINDWWKVHRTIHSSKTPEQIKSSKRMLDNYCRKYPGARYNVSRQQLELEYISKRDGLGFYDDIPSHFDSNEL